MKKSVLVVAVAVLGMFACKKKVEAPAPEVKKYVYTRTSGNATQIVGDIFVDTGGTVFTVKGKNFDPKKRKYYHLLMGWTCNTYGWIGKVNGYDFSNSNYVDTARLVNITDSTLLFKVDKKNIYNVRDQGSQGTVCTIKDTVALTFAVTSKDSTKSYAIETHLDILQEKKVRNKLFFNLLSDTLHWHTKLQTSAIEISLDDIRAGVLYGDMVQVYFSNVLLNSGNLNIINFTSTFDAANKNTGDCFFMFQKDFYNLNKSLGLTEGFYNVTMKEVKTGLVIEEKHGKKGIYVKFVD